jgi:hypothetical protein
MNEAMRATDCEAIGSHDFRLVEYQAGVDYARLGFEQMMTMASRALLFNGALAAAAGVATLEGLNFFREVAPDLSHRPWDRLWTGWAPSSTVEVLFGFALLSLVVVAALFNIGALRAHNNVWRLIDEHAARLRAIEEEVYGAETPKNTIHALYEKWGREAAERSNTTGILTNCFFLAIAAIWIVYGFMFGWLTFGAVVVILLIPGVVWFARLGSTTLREFRAYQKSLLQKPGA